MQTAVCALDLDSIHAKLQATIQRIGPDYLILLEGPNTHLGAVSLAQPYQRQPAYGPVTGTKSMDMDLESDYSACVSTLSQYGHRDAELVTKLARELAKELKKVVVVIGGIHIEKISKEQLEEIMTKILELKKEILRTIRQNTD
jgi:hypothetical protein